MPGRHPLLLAVLLAAALLVATPVLGQSRDLAGREIKTVSVEGNVTLTEEDLLYYLGLEPGSKYDPAQLNDRLKELWDRDLIDDVQIDAEPLEDGVAIKVTIEERPTLVSIDYQGLDKLKRTDITEMIDKRRLELFEGSQLSKGELARLESEIEALYADKGYRFADATVQLERVSDHELRVMVLIDEGDKVKIGKVTFDGNEVFGDGTLRSAMKKTKKSNIITKLRKRDIYNPATVEEDLDNVREVYHNAGYKNLVVGNPELTVLESGKDSEGRPKKRELGIVIPVEEGERWKLGDILFEGNKVLPDEFLKNAFEEPKGGWLRQDIIDKGMTQLEEFYSNTGYMFARIDSELIERDDLVADVQLTIDEGDQFRVGRIEFSGNSKTKDRVLRRSLRVQEGMVFNSGQLKNSMFRINQLEYFKVHEEDPVELDIDSDDKKVNLTIKGDEAERTELTFGGGYSEIDGFFLQGGIRTRNFLGRGETLGVQIQTGRYTEQFDVSYFIPWLRDKPQNVGFQLFKRDLDYDLYSSQRFVRKEEGGSATYQRVDRAVVERVALLLERRLRGLPVLQLLRRRDHDGFPAVRLHALVDQPGLDLRQARQPDRAHPRPLHPRQPRVRRRLPGRRRLVLPADPRPHLLQEGPTGRAPHGGRHQHRGRPDRPVRDQQRRNAPRGLLPQPLLPRRRAEHPRLRVPVGVGARLRDRPHHPRDWVPQGRRQVLPAQPRIPVPDWRAVPPGSLPGRRQRLR